MPVFILMGVPGSGKSTVGKCAAQSLGLAFIEGDDYHPPENVRKMASGIPLDDNDRIAWIDALMRAVNECAQANVVVACSALTRTVREKIRTQSTRPVTFLHLTADASVIDARLHSRGSHFMKAGMLPSQLAALEPSNEAISIDVTPPLSDVYAAVRKEIESRLSR